MKYVRAEWGFQDLGGVTNVKCEPRELEFGDADNSDKLTGLVSVIRNVGLNP